MKKILVMVIFVLLLNVVFTGCEMKSPETGNGTHVGFIQKAINSASNGDIVYIPNGTYFENIVIDKSIILTGENKGNTLIIGREGESVVLITADNCTFQGFTVMSPGNSQDLIGMQVTSENNIIMNNLILNNTWGIYLDSQSKKNSVLLNNISNNMYGILLRFSSYNNISYNNISLNSVDGSKLTSESTNNVLYGNNISSNKEYGVHLTGSGNNKISRNRIANNQHGIRICCASFNNEIYHNNFIQNNDLDGYDSCDNQWDDGNIGNFWDDYNGIDTDGDGIIDAPYLITGGSHDRYPILNPFEELSFK